MFRKYFIFVLFLSFVISLNAESYEDIFYKANKLYAGKDYKKANEEYLKITNIKSSSVYYNLASSYFMLKDIGRSVLWYERALLLSPFDKEIESAVEMNTERKNSLKVIKALNYAFSFLFLITLTLAFLFCVLFVYNKKIFQGKILKPALLLSVLLIFLFSVIVIQKIENTEHIIIIDKANLYQANNENSKSIKPLAAGEKMNILEEYEKWYYVKDALGSKGWVKKAESEKI